MNIRVLLVDDHKIMRAGLRSLLAQHQELEVVGEAENGRRAVQLVAEIQPQVVVMDVSMPDLNGIEATRQMVAALPAVKVLGLSMHSDKRFVIGMLQAGAAGYLLKDCATEELASAIRAVAAGQSYLSPAVTGLIIEDCLGRTPSPAAAISPAILSSREREVLQLIAEGSSTRDIASRLFVSVKTVETHRRQIMKKLDLYTVADLTKYAVREGLTSLE